MSDEKTVSDDKTAQSGNSARLRQLAARLSEELGEPVTVHGAWGPMQSGELSVFRWVYSYPTWRMATLQHWRDEGEWILGGEHVVAIEASKVARLLLKGYEPAVEWFGAQPIAADSHGFRLADASRRCGLTERSVSSPAERFAIANDWLETLRKR